MNGSFLQNPAIVAVLAVAFIGLVLLRGDEWVKVDVSAGKK